MVHLILASTYTNDILTLAFDPIARTLDVVSSITVGHHPSWITFYPGDHSLVFAGLEQSDGKILALKYNEEGKGKVVAEASSGGADPCSLIATKTQLYVANYSGGTVACIPISSNPPYILASSPAQIVRLKGRGLDPTRQEAPHPHQVVIHEQYNELLVPDLGTDVVRRFAISEEGLLFDDQKQPVQYEPGSGPRHIALHDGNLYTLLELSNTVTKHHFPSFPDVPTQITSSPSMSKPPPTSDTPMLAAAILIPPPNNTYPAPYLYLSNRNDPSPLGDIISVFNLSNEMKVISEVRSGLNHLRGMAFGGTDDRWLVAGGVNGGGVSVFERVDGGKRLRVVAEQKDVEAPTGFLWA